MFAPALETGMVRYERKFVISELSACEVETAVKLHPAMFSQAYPGRVVNNLYFDSFDLKNYRDHVSGLNRRKKVRIRWYGPTFGTIEKPVLELKIRNGLLGRKQSFPLNPFLLDDAGDVRSLADLVGAGDIPDVLRLELGWLNPTLLNRYRRKYYQSADGRYRITIDTEMVTYRLVAHVNVCLYNSVDKVNTIVELKYDHGRDGDADRISNQFPFRLVSSSKYITGVRKLHPW